MLLCYVKIVGDMAEVLARNFLSLLSLSLFWTLRVIILFFLFIFFSFDSLAVGMRGAKILQVSSSGKSIRINRGELDGVREGDKGKFLFQTKTDTLNVYYVAAGEAVKVFTRESYWFLRELKSDEFVKKGNELIITSTEETLEGRRPIKINQEQVVLLTGETGQKYISENKNVIPQNLIKAEGEHTSVSVETVQKESRLYDFNSKSFINWAQGRPTEIEGYFGELGTAHISELKGVDRKEWIAKKDRERLYNAQIDGVVEKYNELEYGMQSLYRYQGSSDAFRGNFPKGLGMYQKHKDKMVELQSVSPRAIRKVEEQGQMWSADMSDEELREYIITSGLGREYRRQKFALENRVNNEIILRYHSDLSLNTTITDNDYNSAGHALSLVYEFHLLRLHSVMTPFSIEFDITVSNDYYNLGEEINVKSQERSFGSALNWYFVENPSGINKYLWYVGLGYGAGRAEIIGRNLEHQYQYQVKRVPSYRLGLKYRFRAGDEADNLVSYGLGLNAMFSYESVHLLANEALYDNIDGVKHFADKKLSLGISFYF